MFIALHCNDHFIEISHIYFRETEKNLIALGINARIISQPTDIVRQYLLQIITHANRTFFHPSYAHIMKTTLHPAGQLKGKCHGV